MFEVVVSMMTGLGLSGWIACAVFIIFSFFIYRRSFPPISRLKRGILSGLRAMTFLFLIILIVNPIITYQNSEERKPLIPVLVDVSKSMNIEDCSGGSRFESSISVLSRLVNMGDEYSADMEIIPFSSSVNENSIPEDSLPEANGEGTMITAALKTVANRYRYSNTPGIILLSDGVQTDQDRLTEGFELPVYSVGFGDSSGGGYLSIEDVIYENRVYAGMKTSIEVVSAAGGLNGDGQIKARLFEDGKLIDSLLISTGKDIGEYRADFDYTAGKAARHRMKIEMEYEEERLSGRRIEEFNINILKETQKILYIDEHADWNMTFLRNLADEMKRYEFDFVTWNREHGFIKLPEYLKWQFPTGSPGLKRYDLVIISDAEKIFSIRENADNLIEYTRDGGGVLFLADGKSPLNAEVSYKLIESVVPAEKVSVSKISGGEYYLKLPQDRNNPITIRVAESGDIYNLPPLTAYLYGFSPSMGTEIPLYLTDKNKDDLKPLIAVERIESGVSGLLFGMSLWKWKLSGSDRENIYNVIFSALIQYVASGAQSHMLDVVPSRNRYTAGEKPDISVYLSAERKPRAIKGKLYKIEKNEENLLRTFIFDPEITKRGIYRSKLSLLNPGRYRVAAREILDSGRGFEGETEFSVDSLSVEYIQRSMDGEFLKRLSEKSGGRFYLPEKVDEIFSSMTPHTDKIEITRKSSFRTNVIFLVVIISMLTAEWILRKLWNMV